MRLLGLLGLLRRLLLPILMGLLLRLRLGVVLVGVGQVYLSRRHFCLAFCRLRRVRLSSL